MTTATQPNGPLTGLRVVEFAGIGPGPYAAMLLADMGADVVRIDRPGAQRRRIDVTQRGRRIVTLDLKLPADIAAARSLIDHAEVLIEGFRPGVMERLGLGPAEALARNPRLVYGRMTGWGQEGPLAQRAGHDIDYIAITGALAAIGPGDGRPNPPLNLVGDFGGGSLYLVMGLLAAVLQARASGQGQVVDCAISDCVVHMLSMFHGMLAAGTWTTGRESNLLDGGAPYYGTYECADGKYLALGALEPQFYATLRERAGLSDPLFDEQRDQALWPRQKAALAAVIRRRSRDEWAALLQDSDACAAPVLTLAEAPAHPHLKARGAFIERDGVVQSAPAPRFSATPSAAGQPPSPAAAAEVLAGDGDVAVVGTLLSAETNGLAVLARDIDRGSVGAWWIMSRELRVSPRPDVLVVAVSSADQGALGDLLDRARRVGLTLRGLAAAGAGSLFRYGYLVVLSNQNPSISPRGALAGLTGSRLIGAFESLS